MLFNLRINHNQLCYVLYYFWTIFCIPVCQKSCHICEIGDIVEIFNSYWFEITRKNVILVTVQKLQLCSS